MAYLSQTDSLLPEGTRPQQVRSVDTSWLIKGMFFELQEHFYFIYLEDSWSQEGDKYSLGPLHGSLCCECLEIFISNFLTDGRGILSGRLLLLEFQ